MESRGKAKRSSGLTLVELLVTLTVSVVILGLAVPSFYEMIQDNRVVTHTNNLVTSLSLARSEAVRRNRPVRLSPCDTSETCAGMSTSLSSDGNWSNGWVVWYDDDDDGDVSDNDNNQIRISNLLQGDGTVSGVNAAVEFAATGEVSDTATFYVSQPESEIWRCVSVSLSGGVKVNANDNSCVPGP